MYYDFFQSEMAAKQQISSKSEVAALLFLQPHKLQYRHILTSY